MKTYLAIDLIRILYLFLRTQGDSFEFSEVEAGVGLGVSCPLKGKVPAASPPLLPDFIQVCLDGKQPPLPAAAGNNCYKVKFDSKIQRFITQ